MWTNFWRYFVIAAPPSTRSHSFVFNVCSLVALRWLCMMLRWCLTTFWQMIHWNGRDSVSHLPCLSKNKNTLQGKSTNNTLFYIYLFRHCYRVVPFFIYSQFVTWVFLENSLMIGRVSEPLLWPGSGFIFFFYFHANCINCTIRIHFIREKNYKKTIHVRY